MSKKKDYEVGYGRPPKQTQFKKGQSGNPNGRPKGTKNFATELAEELEERIVIRESGKTKRVSKQRAVIKALVAKSLNGDIRALAQLISCLARDSEEQSESIADKPLAPQDAAILQRFRQRLMEATVSQGASPGAPSGDEAAANGTAPPAPRKRRRLQEEIIRKE